jgi:succinate dehydrogenase/fumarate reductase flavoprotein subunit
MDEMMGWAEEFDVVVCGFGGAGTAAAIEAHDQGARVLVVEKSLEGGGSTAESGGSIPTILDRDRAVEHYVGLTEGRTPRDVIDAYVAAVEEIPAWVEGNGGAFEMLPMNLPPFPTRFEGTAYENIPGSEGIGDRRRIREEGVNHGGTSLWNFLKANFEHRGIEVRLGTPARRLIQDRDGSVAGVEVDANGERRRIRARRGVVLATGGFSYGHDMLREYVGVVLPGFGPPGRNTGDGIRMAIQAGADLWHMNSIAAGFGYQVPGVGAAWMCRLQAYGFFIVDSTGRRFLNEPTVEHHAAGNALVVRDFRTGSFPRLPSYIIFDERTRLAGKVATNEAGANRVLVWSDDNEDEIAKGWISRGETIDELAGAVGLPAEPLAQTLAAFNRAAAEGGDEFGRRRDQMVALDQLPYYAIAVMPSLFNTQGGPRRDPQARVVGIDGQAIPGLFSAGELGSIWVSLYPGAGNVPEAIAFGRIAGRSAAQRLVTSRVPVPPGGAGERP